MPPADQRLPSPYVRVRVRVRVRARVRVRVRGGDSRPVNQTQNVSTRAVTVHVGCDA